MKMEEMQTLYIILPSSFETPQWIDLASFSIETYIFTIVFEIPRRINQERKSSKN
jgi:hypothetical protein